MEYTFEKWQAEGNRRFGDDIANWRFICPACGRVNRGQEFKEAGASPDDMYKTCIGRHNGKGVDGMNKHKTPPEHGCNWAAFGLFGTLGKGDTVIKDGNNIDVFAFAELL